MDELLDIFSKYPVNICYAFNIYATKIDIIRPTNVQKTDMHRAVLLFSEYWNKHKDDIVEIDELSNLATIFVNNLLFINEYDEVCISIHKYISKNQNLDTLNS